MNTSETAITAARSFVLDASNGPVEVYSETFAAYTDDEYRALLDGAGFTQVEIQASFGATTHPDMMVITARRPLGTELGVAQLEIGMHDFCCVKAE